MDFAADTRARSRHVAVDCGEEQEDERDPLPARFHPKTRGGTKQRQRHEQVMHISHKHEK